MNETDKHLILVLDNLSQKFSHLATEPEIEKLEEALLQTIEDYDIKADPFFEEESRTLRIIEL